MVVVLCGTSTRALMCTACQVTQASPEIYGVNFLVYFEDFMFRVELCVKYKFCSRTKSGKSGRETDLRRTLRKRLVSNRFRSGLGFGDVRPVALSLRVLDASILRALFRPRLRGSESSN